MVILKLEMCFAELDGMGARGASQKQSNQWFGLIETSGLRESPMRELAGLIAIIAALVGIFLIWGSVDRTGLFGLLLLTGAGLFLQYCWLSASARRTYELLSQQIARLEDQLKPSQNKSVAEQYAAADRPPQ